MAVMNDISCSNGDGQDRIAALTKKLEYINRNTECLISGGDFSDAVRQVLESVRTYYEADRSYLFEIDMQRRVIQNTFERCAPGVSSEIERFHHLPMDFFNVWKEKFEQQGYLLVKDVEHCDDYELYKGVFLREHLKSQAITDLLAVPIFIHGSYRGFAGVDNPQVSLEDVDFFVTMVRYIVTLKEMRQQEQTLRKRYEDEQAFIDSVADRYLFSARANLTKDRIEDMWGTDVFSYEEDALAYSDDVATMMEHILNQDMREEYSRIFSREALLQAYERGKETISEEFGYIRGSCDIRWVHREIKLLSRPDSGDVIAFITEQNITREKITGMVMSHVIATQYDYIRCILSRDKMTTIININQEEDSDDIYKAREYDQAIQEYADKYVLSEERQAYLSFMNLKNVWKLLDAGKPCSHTFSFRIGGQLRYKKIDFFCLDKESRLLAQFRTDYTALQMTQLEQEETLRTALHMAEQAGLAKDDFLARMSHDIRTPLNGIIGMTDLARGINTSPQVENYLEKIHVSSQFLTGLVNDILDMSKIAAGKMTLHMEPYSEAEFIRYITSVIKPLCDAKHIHFHFMDQISFNSFILTDKLKYNQIFFNLLSNAVKFTPDGGNVTLAMENMVLTTERLEADFIVKDDGIGMSAAFQKRLFQPFEQEDTEHDREQQGTGLGLAIAKSFADLLGGTIRVQSSPGAGTTFTLHFAFTVVPPQETEVSQNVTLSLRGRHILIAEDNAINREILMTVLKQAGASVMVAENGRKAVQKFQESLPGSVDIILMDVRMPVLDGLEATREIRSLPRGDAAAVPIIAITANAYEEDIQACLVAGMNDHVAKPVELEHLLAVLRPYV